MSHVLSQLVVPRPHFYRSLGHWSWGKFSLEISIHYQPTSYVFQCGHGAFSDHKWLNDSLGFVSWKFKFWSTLTDGKPSRSFIPFYLPHTLVGKFLITATIRTTLPWNAMKYTFRRRGAPWVFPVQNQPLRTITINFLAILQFTLFSCLFANNCWHSLPISVSSQPQYFLTTSPE